MRVLVTGHHGYIGSLLVPLLQEQGHEVVGLDTDYFVDCLIDPESGASAPPVRSIRKDIRAVEAADLEGIDAVCHLSALSNDPMGEMDPELTADINFRASVRLAELAKAAGASRFLFSSSCSVYGAAGDIACTESAPLAPLTAYARSKVETEQALAALAGPDFAPAYLRNATAYGASSRVRIDLVLNNLVAAAITTGKVLVLSDGTPWRPLVHAEDIARTFVALLDAPADVIRDQPFNVGAESENYRVSELAEIVREVVPGSTIEYAPGGTGDDRTYRVDFSRLYATLPGFALKWSARSGAEHLYAQLQRAHFSAADMEGHRYVRLRHLQQLRDSGQIDERLRWTTEAGQS